SARAVLGRRIDGAVLARGVRRGRSRALRHLLEVLAHLGREPGRVRRLERGEDRLEAAALDAREIGLDPDQVLVDRPGDPLRLRVDLAPLVFLADGERAVAAAAIEIGEAEEFGAV